MKSLSRTLRAFAIAAAAMAVLRYFAKGVLSPLGVSDTAGTFLVSLWLLLVVALLLLFGRCGRDPAGRWKNAALAFVALAAWCEALVIAGILVTEATGAETYYNGPWDMVREEFPTAGEHAMGHVVGFFPRTAIGLILGSAVYWVARRQRPV